MAVLTETLPRVSVSGVDMDLYSIVEVHLNKQLLRPSELNFTIRRKQLLRGDSDVLFEVARQMMGSRVTLQLATQRRTEYMEATGESLDFEGLVMGAQSECERMGQVAYLHVTAYSTDYLLLDNPHCCSFERRTLADIVKEVVQPYADSLKLEVDPQYEEVIPYVVQYNETSYQFLSRLAQRYGEFLYFDGGRLYFGRSKPGNNVMLYPDVDVLGYSYDVNMEHIGFAHAQHNYLRYENDTRQGASQATDTLHNLSNTAYSRSASLYRKQTLQVLGSATQEDATSSQTQLSTTVQAWGTKGRMMQCSIRLNRADVGIGDHLMIQERADAEGDNIVLHDVLMVIGVECGCTRDGHFQCTVQTLPADVHYAPYHNPDLYPLSEGQRARVVDNRDPEALGRIRVQFLWQEPLTGNRYTPWLRIAQPHGGNDKGFYFIPEIGEEVLVDFEYGNAEKPYVIGTLYHGKQRPGSAWYDEKNNVKAIRTRNGHTVEIHDEGNGGYIRIYDYQKENYILTYSTDEKLIRLESTGNIELYAANDIIMKAGHDIVTESGHDTSETAGHDMFLSAGNDQQRTADNDILEHAGNDRTASIGRNDTTSVGENQFVKVGDNKDERVAHKVQLTAENIRTEASKQLLEYSNTHHIKANDQVAINSGSRIDIKSGVVKVQ